MRKYLALASFLGALLAAPALHAQAPSAAASESYCRKSSDPRACEERRAKVRDAFKLAAESCKGKDGADRRSCMVEHMCAQTKDPGKCRDGAADRSKRRGQQNEPPK